MQTYLEIPSGMDVQNEETAWFRSGGDGSGKTFAQYLIDRGATNVDIERWTINYQ